MPAAPTPARNWDISTTRVSYTTVAGVLGVGMYTLKTKLLAQGYLMWASSDGTAGPSGLNDRTDRITDATKFATRAASAAAAQSWFMVKDGNGVYTLITYQGASDDIVRVSQSVGGYTLPPVTPTHQPTATDERITVSATVVATTTSGDRIFHIWVSADAKAFRVAVVRAGIMAGNIWGVEDVAPAEFAGGVSFDPPVWGFAFLPTGSITSAYAANSTGGLATVNVASVLQSASCSGTTEYGGVINQAIQTSLTGGFSILQNDYVITGNCLVATTAACRGRLGQLVDWWTGPSLSAGETLGDRTLIAFGGSILWPWNGTVPVMT